MKWTAKHESAVVLVAEDRKSDTQIAESLGISKRTLETWKADAEFARQVEAHVLAVRDAVRKRGIAVLENRVKRLSTDWQKLQDVIEARAADARETRARNEALLEEALRLGSDKVQIARLENDLPHVAPGMETGLVVRDYKGSGPFIREVYSVDTATLAELRATEQQAAKELGQWTEKRELTGAGGAALFGEMTDDDLDRRLAAAETREAAPAVPG